VTYPAKFQVLRAEVDDARLDALVETTARANGDTVTVEFAAAGERWRFTERIEDGRIRFDRRLPDSQRRADSGIVEIHYAGNERVRPAEVRLRAAARKARLQRSLLSLEDGEMVARGSVTDRADGVVRLSLSYDRPAGSVGVHEARAKIGRDGRWALSEPLPADAREGGYLSIEFTGHHSRHIRGERIAKQLLDGQAFRTASP
jgi:hypothetical protein